VRVHLNTVKAVDMATIDPTTQEIHAKLNEFFPPDHPNSPWLLRLMLIRDDVHFEWSSIHKEAAGVDENWRLTYFLRRISISLLEAKNIFCYEFGDYLKKHKAADPRKQDATLLALTPHFDEAIAIVTDVAPQLRGLRDSVGAHLRPEYADTKLRKIERMVLNNHPMLEGTVKILGPTEEVSYRALSAFAILFAWPEADDNDKAMARLVNLHGAITKLARLVNYSIDAILLHHWIRLGVVKPPGPMGVRSLTDPDEYEPIS
jgi:hypothetical protein